jgi:hypothetical protein
VALTIRGLSRCAICGQIIRADEDLVSLPAFVPNDRDRLSRFSDAAVHARCVVTCPDAQEALRWSEIFLDINRPAQRRRRACGGLIADWRDHLGFGLITSDLQNSLSEYNFVQLHRSHVHEWPDVARVVLVLKEQRLEEIVWGTAADRLTEELSALAWS